MRPVALRSPVPPSIPLEWRYVEKRHPGAMAAWRHVGIPVAEFILGDSGGPDRVIRAIARDRRCYDPSYTTCRCMRFVDGVWMPRIHVRVRAT